VIREAPLGFWVEHPRHLWGNQIWFDLLLAAGVAWALLVPRARRLGQAAGAFEAVSALGSAKEEGLGQSQQGGGQARRAAPPHHASADRLAAQAHDGPGRCTSRHRDRGPAHQEHVGLNRGILDAAWGGFTRQLTYKVECSGGRVILVNPAYTGRTCRICGHESAGNRKTQSVFACVACGHTENADVHAAKTILAAGHAVWSDESKDSSTDACGGEVRRGLTAKSKRAASKKQEPTEAKVLV